MIAKCHTQECSSPATAWTLARRNASANHSALYEEQWGQHIVIGLRQVFKTLGEVKVEIVSDAEDVVAIEQARKREWVEAQGALAVTQAARAGLVCPRHPNTTLGTWSGMWQEQVARRKEAAQNATEAFRAHNSLLRAVWIEEGRMLLALLPHVVEVWLQAKQRLDTVAAQVSRLQLEEGATAALCGLGDNSTESEGPCAQLKGALEELRQAEEILDKATDARSELVVKLYASGVDLLKMAILDRTKSHHMAQLVQQMVQQMVAEPQTHWDAMAYHKVHLRARGAEGRRGRVRKGSMESCAALSMQQGRSGGQHEGMGASRRDRMQPCSVPAITHRSLSHIHIHQSPPCTPIKALPAAPMAAGEGAGCEG